MTPYDIEPEADRAIDELLDAAGEEAESDPSPRPPFGAVLDRARRLDPSLAAPSPSPTDSMRGRLDDAALADALAPFVTAARDEAELDVTVQRHAGPPGLPRVRRSLVRWIVVGGTLAAAAAVVLMLGLLEVRSALRADARLEGSQAVDQAEADRPVLEAATGGDDSVTPGRGARLGRDARPRETSRDPVVPEEPVPLEDVAPVEVIPEEPVPLDPVEVSAAVEAPPAAPPAPRVDRGARRREALQRLDAVASARLAAGDAAGAEEAYRAIVRKAGQSGLAELAYGDLFTLAHGRRDRAAQQRLWREYLDDFPRGRFADDARAGLCRSLGGEPQAECWTRYLDDFPTGAYHRQAERALGRE